MSGEKWIEADRERAPARNISQVCMQYVRPILVYQERRKGLRLLEHRKAERTRNIGRRKEHEILRIVSS